MRQRKAFFRVRFLDGGMTNNLIAASDLLVRPSRHEPLGNVTEGWAQDPCNRDGERGIGRPCRHGETALVPVDDATALSGQLQHALADKSAREALAIAGRAAYDRKFSKRKVIKRYIGFFQHLAADSATML